MLVAENLATVLVQAVRNQREYISMQKWCDALAKYILENAELTFQWTGVLNKYPYTPDPIVIAKGKFVSLQIPAMRVRYITDMGIMIQKGMVKGTVNITDSGFSTIAQPFGISPALVTTWSKARTPYEAQLHISKQIVPWVKAWVVSGVFAPKHGQYIGTGMHIATK